MARKPIIKAIQLFLIIFGVLFVICLFTGGELFGLKHLLIFSFCSIPLCILGAYGVENIGEALGGLLSGWAAGKPSIREQLSADLAKAKSRKATSQFEKALTTINDVLDKDPDFPDALYLKAQILWEGFRNSSDAKKCAQKVMLVVPYEEHLHRWASNYYDEIIAAEKKRLNDWNPNRE